MHIEVFNRVQQSERSRPMSRTLSLDPRAAWRNALERAAGRDPDEQAEYLFTADAGDEVTVTAFEVRSYTEAELTYKAQVWTAADGDVTCSCTCPATAPCWHLAVALNR